MGLHRPKGTDVGPLEVFIMRIKAIENFQVFWSHTYGFHPLGGSQSRYFEITNILLKCKLPPPLALTMHGCLKRVNMCASCFTSSSN